MITTILIEVIISWIATLIVGQRVPGGTIGNIIIGFIGAWLGGMLLGNWGLTLGGVYLFPAFLGASILIFLWGALMKTSG